MRRVGSHQSKCSRHFGRQRAGRPSSTSIGRWVSETTFYRGTKQYTGLDVSELRELKQLRDENRRLKTAVADLTLDKTILRDALGIAA